MIIQPDGPQVHEHGSLQDWRLMTDVDGDELITIRAANLVPEHDLEDSLGRNTGLGARRGAAGRREDNMSAKSCTVFVHMRVSGRTGCRRNF